MRHLLSINDLSRSDMERIFRIADGIRRGNRARFRGVLALLFEKPSTRTRVSFESAVFGLGGHSIYVDQTSSQISRGETIEDTGRIISSYVDMIAARLYSQEDLVRLAASSSVPVINALTDLEHPTQSIADFYTIREHKRIRGLRIAFMGDIGNNTANSLMLAATKLGAEVVLVGPEREVHRQYLKMARRYGKVEMNEDPDEGVRDADIIYTDTFISMGEEKEAEKRRKEFRKYQVNKRLLWHAKKGTLVMHCLPAHREEEITSEVLDGPRSIAWEEAKNKMLVEQAIILFLKGKGI